MHHGDVDSLRPQLVGQVLGHGGHRHVAHAADDGARLARGKAAPYYENGVLTITMLKVESKKVKYLKASGEKLP